MEEVSDYLLRILPDLVMVTAALMVQAAGAWWILRRMAPGAGPLARWMVLGGMAVSFTLLVVGFLLRFNRVGRHFPVWLPGWGRGTVMAYALLSMAWLAIFALTEPFARRYAGHHPSRRRFLRTAQAALFGAPVAVLGYGTFVQRKQIHLREQRVEIPELPRDLDGLRIVQLTDIHLSPFLSRRELDYAVALANDSRAHLAVVTGDLITTSRDPLDDCLDSLAAVRADAGIFGCLGNHEIYAGAENYTARQGASRGIRFLRGEAVPLRFGGASLNLVGVDYQRTGRPYLRRAAGLVDPASYNVLLSHNPDVFPVAARQGYGLTISGHTHGGQVRVEILRVDLNVARFYTPYVDGLYRQGPASIFVSRGIGTIGIPTRLGAPPEVALLRLCRT